MGNSTPIFNMVFNWKTTPFGGTLAKHSYGWDNRTVNPFVWLGQLLRKAGSGHGDHLGGKRLDRFGMTQQETIGSHVNLKPSSQAIMSKPSIVPFKINR